MDANFKNAEGVRVKQSNALVNKLRTFYKSLAKELAKDIEKINKDKRYSDAGKKMQLIKIKQDIEKQLIALNTELEKDIINSMDVIIQEVIEENNEMLIKAGMNIQVGVAYATIKPDIIEQLVSGSLYEGKWSLSTAIWGDTEEILSEIDTIIAKGITTNKTTYEIAKELEKYVNPTVKKPWDWSKVYPGSRKVIDYNAQRLARTMTAHAYEESFVRVTKENPFIDSYRWLIANNHRVCEICEARATEDHGLGEPGLYPKDKLPLDHPNGQCTFVAEISKTSEQINDDLVDWIAGRGNKNLNKQLDVFAKDISDNS